MPVSPKCSASRIDSTSAFFLWAIFIHLAFLLPFAHSQSITTATAPNRSPMDLAASSSQSMFLVSSSLASSSVAGSGSSAIASPDVSATNTLVPPATTTVGGTSFAGAPSSTSDSTEPGLIWSKDILGNATDQFWPPASWLQVKAPDNVPLEYYYRTSQKGAKVTFYFNGTGIGILDFKGPSRGFYNITIDNDYAQSALVNAYSSVSDLDSVGSGLPNMIYESSQYLEDGEHLVTISMMDSSKYTNTSSDLEFWAAVVNPDDYVAGVTFVVEPASHTLLIALATALGVSAFLLATVAFLYLRRRRRQKKQTAALHDERSYRVSIDSRAPGQREMSSRSQAGGLLMPFEQHGAGDRNGYRQSNASSEVLILNSAQAESGASLSPGSATFFHSSYDSPHSGSVVASMASSFPPWNLPLTTVGSSHEQIAVAASSPGAFVPPRASAFAEARTNTIIVNRDPLASRRRQSTAKATTSDPFSDREAVRCQDHGGTTAPSSAAASYTPEEMPAPTPSSIHHAKDHQHHHHHHQNPESHPDPQNGTDRGNRIDRRFLETTTVLASSASGRRIIRALQEEDAGSIRMASDDEDEEGEDMTILPPPYAPREMGRDF
ncbi:hypothetical protein IE53DRAFT_360123 [Violaceomyces palustris]|uniref:Uncharacterized protein n=1 Tax=Violaceomyces palustris TaxID=1673888 RepID=A0ACD0P5F6_9BASI|nr:hypothetical protein IE53DRAFT_360123 [Violaceomyces palustris]